MLINVKRELKKINYLTREEKKSANKAYLKRNLCIFLMMIPVVAWFLVFAYWPLYFLRMAFYDYSYLKGFSGSEFVGLQNFSDFFKYNDGWHLIGNTLAINLLALFFLFPCPIILAILFNEINNKIFKRSLQTLSYIPHFLSTTALVGIIYLVFDAGEQGLINNLLINVFHVDQQFFLTNPKWFRFIQVVSGIWQTCGWSTIVYTAAILSVNPQLYEAAKVEGAGHFRQIKDITLPALLPTIMIMLTLQLGSIMGSNFEKILLLQNNQNINVSEVVLTFTYKQMSNPGFGTAIGLLNSAVGLVFVIASNQVSKKISKASIW